MTARRIVLRLLQPADAGDRASRIVDIILLSAILVSVGGLVLGTVPELHARYGMAFRAVELVTVSIFVVEYLLRLWCCVEIPGHARPVTGRIRFALRPMPLIDLAAILPSVLMIAGFDLRALRLARVLRIAVAGKFGRYSRSLRLLVQAFVRQRDELIMSLFILAGLLIVSSTVVYYAEHGAQPDSFSSIPATMWWAIATLTTVGYGDMYPITPLGRVFGAVSAILGIGMFALPTGLLAAGFAATLEEDAQQRRDESGACPTCGRSVESQAI